MTEDKEPVYVRYVKLTPKGKELFERILSIVEDNVDLAAKGLDQLVQDMQTSEKTQEVDDKL